MRQDAKKTIKISALSVFFLLIIAYALFGSHNLIFGIRIKNINIVDGEKITDGMVKMTGNAKNATNLTLNGREISINQDGDFNETIMLLAGYNVVSIIAKDKFGYVDKKDYKLILTQALGS